MDSYYKLSTSSGLGYIYPTRTFKGETEITIDLSNLVELVHPIIKIEINFTDDTDHLIKTFSFSETNKLELDLIKHTFRPSVNTYNTFYYPTITITYLNFSIFRYQLPIKIAQNSFYTEIGNMSIGNAQFIDDEDNSVFVTIDTSKGNSINKLFLSKSLPLSTTDAQKFRWIRQPNNIIINEYQTATFVVSAVYNDQPVSYSWYRTDGSDINTINHVSNILKISDAQIQDTMVYYCIASVTTTEAITSKFASLQVKELPTPPTITLQPISQTVIFGNPVTFNIQAQGTEPLSYQWKINGIDDLNETNSTYTIPNIKVNVSDITCRVKNIGGSVISNSVNITLINPPSIVSQPLPIVIKKPNESLSLILKIEGDKPFNFRWYKNDIDTGITDEIFTINSLEITDSGTYKCVVSNIAGSETTKDIVVVVDSTYLIVRNNDHLVFKDNSFMNLRF